MTPSELESDWLQDTLLDVARRLRVPNIVREELNLCATVIERIVADLQSPLGSTTKPTDQSGRRNWRRVLRVAAIGVAVVLILRGLHSRRDEE